jgi:threonine aldolase
MSRNRLIDLSSDTATRPSAGMRRSMAEAEVGDEQKGEDPTTRALEDRIAALLGHEAAVFMPSGTMCNQIALAVHTTAGDEVLGAENCHIFVYEGGGGAVLARHQSWPIRTGNGIFSGADVTAAVRVPSRYHPRTRLVTVEQTANLGGGAVWSLAQLNDVATTAKAHGLILHMDGARLPNAVVASGVSAKSMAGLCDSAWFDLSKGLGCPIGGVLVGSKEFIREAWQWKQRIGGAFRQSGIIAAAGLYALDHNWHRLADDHANAKRLGQIAGNVKGVAIVNAGIETNLLFLDVTGTGRPPAEICAGLEAKGVRMTTSYGGRIRAVTHLDVSAADIESAGKAFADVIAGRA